MGKDGGVKFSVAYDIGYGQNKKPVFLDCVMWGERGKKVGQYLTKGTIVELVGEPSPRAYKDKSDAAVGVIQVRVDNVKLWGGPKRDEPVYDKTPSGKGSGPADMGDDIPFSPWR